MFPPQINSCAFRTETLGCNCFKGWHLRATTHIIKRRGQEGSNAFQRPPSSVSEALPFSYLTRCTWLEA